jgi:hypothetical membrane protein
LPVRPGRANLRVEVGAMTNAEKCAAVGGFLWIVAAVQCFVAQVVVAADWRPPYDWWDNGVSALGDTTYSPLAVAMNASLIIAGLLVVSGLGLMRSRWPETALATAGLMLWVLAGAGKVLAGAVPENENLAVHLVGTLYLPVADVAILLLGLASRRTRLGVFGIMMAALGLLGLALSAFAPELLGVGGAERLAGYPAEVWLFVVGGAALLPSRRSGEMLAQVP